MSEEKNVKNDDVDLEAYNKTVAAHNEVKLEKERVQKELDELKAKNVEVEKAKEEDEKVSVEKEREAWKKEKEELTKQNEDLKNPVDNSKVSKGVVKEVEESSKPEEVQELAKKQLDEVIPDREKDPEKMGRWARYGYYKSPATEIYNKRDLAKGLALHANAQSVNPSMVNTLTARSPKDMSLRKV